ncbi:uncharacterized protein [Arachis hypogaea]|uniref:uncharacterized protein n=1 Tax=Arachis hypogaea TaxID=3818 RepID=UPI000DED02A7|nr:uncharacterized protein LOC112735669 [Arachis hypogaea]
MGKNQGGIAILGDFNSITTPEEKSGGGDMSLSSMTAFNLFIGDNDLVDLGSPMYIVPQKLKLCSHKLVQWQQSNRSNSKKEIETLKARLEEISTTGICGGIEIHEVESKLEKAYLNEELYWKEKSRVKWLREGDRNTAFFHRKFKVCTMGNKICRLVGGNREVVSSQADIARVAEKYFTGIFSSTNQVDLEPFLADFESKVTAFMNRRLQKTVSDEKIKRSTFSVHPQSAPGDDGMTVKFFQFYWDIVNEDVTRAVKSFFEGGRILKSFNHTNICLILKVPDAINMSQASEESCDRILELLESYESFSRQKINLSKSAIFFSNNTPDTTQEILATTMNITYIGAQDKYLGLPLVINRSKRATFNSIKDRVFKKVQGWKKSLLSNGDHQILIWAVGEAVPIYTLSCFRLPDTLLKDIHSISTQFWWGQHGEKRRMVWISWDKMTRPKSEGGLGVKDLRAHDLALLGKQCWRLIPQPNSLLARILKGGYYRYGDLLSVDKGVLPSWGWQSLLQGRSVVEKGTI